LGFISQLQFKSKRVNESPVLHLPLPLGTKSKRVDESLALHLLHDDLLPLLIIAINILFLAAAIMDLGKGVAG
jgi:hypothetical protein